MRSKNCNKRSCDVGATCCASLAIKESRDFCLALGAWGCGAFGGDPVMASTTAKEAIKMDGAGIDEIVFAIPGSGRQSKANLEAFRSTFS